MTEYSSTDIRVFLSSTFSDMQQTRNYLTRKIFPKIEQECARRGISFSVLDLRWGITENESKTGKVIEICIDEINRTRPFFIGLVGERYGWIPDEQEIRKNRHLEEKYPWVREYIGRRCSITEIEMQYGVLNNDSIQDASFFLKKTKPGLSPKNEEEEKLSELRKTILEKAGEGKCTADIYNSVEELGKLVHDRLIAMIEKRFPACEKLNEFDLYYLRGNGNLSALRRNYIDLGNRVRTLESNIVHADTLFVTGESGCGKSALLANSFTDSKEIVVRTAIDDSVNSIGRLISLFLYKLGLTEENAVSTDEEEIIRKYREHTYKEPIIWIIDGLEKLPVEDIYSIMPLLVHPENIRTVISVEEQYFRKNSITDLIHESYPTIVEPSPLNEAEKLLFVSNRLHECGKKLTQRQEMHILSSPFLSNPQLLTIFVEELIQFGIYEKLDAFIERLTTASDIKDFINRVLEITEREFKAGEIETLLSVTAISANGIGEKEYVSECGYTPLAYSALYGAAEPFIYRQDGALIIKNSRLRTYILERYLNTAEKRNATARLCTRLLLKEKKHFNKGRKLTFLEKLIYKVIRCYPITEASQRFNKIHGELIMQYISLGQWKKANKLLYNFFLSTNALGHGPYLSLLCRCIEHGLDVRRLFSTRNILFFNFAGRETVLFISKAMLAFLAECHAESYRPLRRHFRLMPIPRKLKRTLIDITDKAFGKKSDIGITGNFEEQWIPGKYDIDPKNAAAIFEQISIISDTNRIKKIQSAADSMISASEKDSLNWIFFTGYSVLCSAMSGNIGTAKELFRNLLESSAISPSSLHYVKFAIAYREADWQSCRELAEELRQWAATMPHKIRLNLLKFVICYRIATEENDSGGNENYNRKDAIAEYEKLAREENFPGSMNFLAQWLTAWQLPEAAADVYASLAADAVNESERANYYYLMAESLESGHVSDWHTIAGIWEKSAGCYLQAGREYYIDMDNALNNANKAYNKVQDWIQAERLIVKRYGYANEMERDYGPEKMAERYNRIAIRCSELKNCPNPETKDITVASLKKSMSAKEDKILYLKNYIFNLENITHKGWLAADDVRDALGFIAPYMELDTAGESLRPLFFLECYCGDEKLAARSLEKAKELGCALSDAGYEWDNLVMKASCSENEAERLKNMEIIKERILGESGHYDWKNCRELKLDKKIKDTCSHEKIDDILFMWMIAKLERDTRQAERLKNEIRKFAIEENGTEIIGRFINLNSRFYASADYITIEWILFQIRLYMDWKPGYATASEWCLTLATLVFNAKCPYNSLKELEQFYTECIAAEENPSETLLEIAEELPRPETGSLFNDTKCYLGIVKAVTAPLRNGIITLDESGHARLERCITKYLEPVTESPDSDNKTLDELYDLYKSLNIKANNKTVSAMLALRIPSMEEYSYGNGQGGDFFRALGESMAEGYAPDTNMLGSITWVYILQGDLQKAAESMSEFETAVKGRKEYAPVLTFFRALLESRQGDYAGAVEKLHEILALIEVRYGHQEEYDDNYWTIPDIFISICRDEFCFEFVFCHSLVLGEIYAGLYKEGLEHSEMLVDYDERTAQLLNCLAMYRSGLPEEAMRLLEKNRHEDDGNDENTYTVRALRLLVALEQARYCAGAGKMTEAAKIVKNAGEHIWKSMPPLCVHEYEQACRLLTGMQ